MPDKNKEALQQQPKEPTTLRLAKVSGGCLGVAFAQAAVFSNAAEHLFYTVSHQINKIQNR